MGLRLRIPRSILRIMLRHLERADLIHCHRGADLTVALPCAPEWITAADILRAENSWIDVTTGDPAIPGYAWHSMEALGVHQLERPM
ncbi:MAG: Rrf2 family transcriptional regulator [Betaproteobacteria bacterium]|nr:Rrf2 family transcriptional regulator [Betaproteobacteria bacterium]